MLPDFGKYRMSPNPNPPGQPEFFLTVRGPDEHETGDGYIDGFFGKLVHRDGPPDHFHQDWPGMVPNFCSNLMPPAYDGIDVRFMSATTFKLTIRINCVETIIFGSCALVPPPLPPP